MQDEKPPESTTLREPWQMRSREGLIPWLRRVVAGNLPVDARSLGLGKSWNARTPELIEPSGILRSMQMQSDRAESTPRSRFPTEAEKFAMMGTGFSVAVLIFGGIIGSYLMIGLGGIYALTCPIAFLIDDCAAEREREHEK